MRAILETASSISEPLTLISFIAALFFLLLRLIIRKNIFPKLSQAVSGNIIVLLINRFFAISIIAMIFGFTGFVLKEFNENPHQVVINGIVFLENRPYQYADVKISQITESIPTDEYGVFQFVVLKKPTLLTFRVLIENESIDSTFTLPERDSWEGINIFLSKKSVQKKVQLQFGEKFCEDFKAKILSIKLTSPPKFQTIYSLRLKYTNGIQPWKSGSPRYKYSGGNLVIVINGKNEVVFDKYRIPPVDMEFGNTQESIKNELDQYLREKSCEFGEEDLNYLLAQL